MARILIIGVGWEQIPLVKKAKEKGLYVIVTTWWDESQIPADKIYKVDSRDLSEIDKIICKEHPDYITADESDTSMYAVAFFSEKYHFYGPKLETQTITNNKFLQRECVRKTSVLQPEYQLCWNLDMARNFAEEIGYPVMIKPIDNCGSIGVSKVHGEDELKDMWLRGVENSYSRECLVEKCIDGDVITADGFCDNAGFEFIAASNKDMYPENDNVAKVLYYPGKFDSKTLEKIKENSEIVANAVGLDFGYAHIEFIIERETNAIYLVEVANRGGGVYISNTILQEITGVDYSDALIDLAMGKDVSAKCEQRYIKKAMLYFMELQENELEINNVREYPEMCQIIHINEKKEQSNVESEASAGRRGVAVLVGDSFETMISAGRSLEEKFANCKEEYFWMKEK